MLSVPFGSDVTNLCKNGIEPLSPCVLHCKFNDTGKVLDMMKEFLIVFCVLYYKCVIDLFFQEP